MTAMLNRKLDFKVNSVSQLLDLIETWGFRQDIRHVKDIKDFKDIMNIVDDNNNNKGNDSEVKIQKIIINFTQTWDLGKDIKDVMDINNIIDDNNNKNNNNDNDNKSCVKKRLGVMQGHQGYQRDQQHYG